MSNSSRWRRLCEWGRYLQDTNGEVDKKTLTNKIAEIKRGLGDYIEREQSGGVSSHYPKYETNIQEIKFKCPRKDCVGTLIENIYNFYCHCCQSTYLKSEVGKEKNG